jgi:hypothetical protein
VIRPAVTVGAAIGGVGVGVGCVGGLSLPQALAAASAAIPSQVSQVDVGRRAGVPMQASTTDAQRAHNVSWTPHQEDTREEVRKLHDELKTLHQNHQKLDSEIKSVQALECPPMLINISRQYTSQAPALGLYEDAREVMTWPGILSASVAMGFYYADVEEMGASFLAVADQDRELAECARCCQ